MHKVLILMSTYNGREKICNQVKSIMGQKKVESYIYIRDDGSDEATIDILKHIAEQYDGRVKVSFQKNVGWKQSFLNLVYAADNVYDYYGFSDQDDIWQEDKLISCIDVAEHDGIQGPKLVHCNSLSVTPNLKQREEQENRIPVPPSFKAAIATEYFQGCGMVWNNAAMTIIQKYHIANKNISHDYWVGLICYLTGNIYFCDRPLFYHIRYENNSSQDGNRKKGRIKRLKMVLSGENAYMNPSQDLIYGYSDYLSEEKLHFLKALKDYKTNQRYKLEILCDRDFKRPSVGATLLLKMSVLLDKY
mgnify:FL=1|jgi:glycosyltransferase involved in cell wall biosynthesis